MKVVSLLGSPRSASNSSAIANRFMKTAQELGAETRSFTLNSLSYRGCQGCYACKTTLERCVLNDDLTEVLAAVSEADLVLMATPVYFGEITGQLKMFMDRTFSYLVPDYRSNPQPSRLGSKKLVFVLTQGNPDAALFDIFPHYEKFLMWEGFNEARLIRVCGIGPGIMDQVPEATLREAEEAARQMLA
jgi:multimeric flavodoxin WrbA